MSAIRFIRTSQRTNCMRKYDVYIDDRLETKLSNGEEKTIDVKPGRHTIYVKIDWCKSQTLDIDCTKDETVELICGSKLVGFKSALALFTLFSTNKMVFLEHYTKEQKIDYGENIPEDQGSKGPGFFIVNIGIVRWGWPVGGIVFLINLLSLDRPWTLANVVQTFVVTMAIFSLGGVVFGVLMWQISNKIKNK